MHFSENFKSKTVKYYHFLLVCCNLVAVVPPTAFSYTQIKRSMTYLCFYTYILMNACMCACTYAFTKPNKRPIDLAACDDTRRRAAAPNK